eukprot:g3676.t1
MDSATSTKVGFITEVNVEEPPVESTPSSSRPRVSLPTVNVYNVEFAELPGECYGGGLGSPAPLPASIPMDKIMSNIAQNLDFKGWSEQARNLWAVIQDTFWFCICWYFKPGKHLDVETRLFDRISANFAVLYAMFLAYPKSRIDFTEKFRKDLVIRISFWTSGICPEFVDTSHWKLNLGGGDVLQAAPSHSAAARNVETNAVTLRGNASQPLLGQLSADSLAEKSAWMGQYNRRPRRKLQYSPLVENFLRARRYSSVNLVRATSMHMTTAEQRAKKMDVKHGMLAERATVARERCEKLCLEYDDLAAEVRKQERQRTMQAQAAKKRLEIRRKEVLRSDPRLLGFCGDGVDFLSKWLAQYAELEEAKTVKAQVEQDLAKMRAQTREKLAAKEAERPFVLADEAGRGPWGLTWYQDKFWQELVTVAQSTAGASAVYLGVLEQGEEGSEITGPHISYEYASKGSEWMTEKVLPEGKGVTWGALTENPAEESFKDGRTDEMCLWKPPSVEPVVETEDGAEPEKPSSPYYPVSVECVTDVASMHYFHMTRLGAYLAIPLVYQSYYNGDAYADAKTYEEEKKAEAIRRAEEEAARQAAIDAGEEVPEAGEPPEEKPLTMRGTDVKMVLCLDTLGTNTAFEEGNAMKILELAKACSQCKSKTEFKQVDNQVLSVIDETHRNEIDEKVVEVADQELIQKKFAFLKALQVAKEMHQLIGGLTSWVYTTSDVMNVVAALARKSTMDWQKLKTLLNDPLVLLEKVVKKEVEGPKKDVPPEHLHNFILQMASPAEMDAEKAKDHNSSSNRPPDWRNPSYSRNWPALESGPIWLRTPRPKVPNAAGLRRRLSPQQEISPAFQLLYNLVQAGCAYRNADLELRKAEFNKKKEEAGEEYEGPALEDLDDDFKETA